MERLTTDKPRTNVETLNNYCTINSDGYAVLGYAGGKDNITLHEYAATCCKGKGCEHMTATHVINTGLMDCYDCPIAIMYYCGAQAAATNKKLSAYEDTGLEPDEIEENEKIINDLTRAICTKNEEIENLKSQLAEYKRRLKSEEKTNERNFV